MPVMCLWFGKLLILENMEEISLCFAVLLILSNLKHTKRRI
jgi:hypothetical protein